MTVGEINRQNVINRLQDAHKSANTERITDDIIGKQADNIIADLKATGSASIEICGTKYTFVARKVEGNNDKVIIDSSVQQGGNVKNKELGTVDSKAQNITTEEYNKEHQELFDKADKNKDKIQSMKPGEEVIIEDTVAGKDVKYHITKKDMVLYVKIEGESKAEIGQRARNLMIHVSSNHLRINKEYSILNKIILADSVEKGDVPVRSNPDKIKSIKNENVRGAIELISKKNPIDMKQLKSVLENTEGEERQQVIDCFTVKDDEIKTNKKDDVFALDLTKAGGKMEGKSFKEVSWMFNSRLELDGRPKVSIDPDRPEFYKLNSTNPFKETKEFIYQKRDLRAAQNAYEKKYGKSEANPDDQPKSINFVEKEVNGKKVLNDNGKKAMSMVKAAEDLYNHVVGGDEKNGGNVEKSHVYSHLTVTLYADGIHMSFRTRDPELEHSITISFKDNPNGDVSHKSYSENKSSGNYDTRYENNSKQYTNFYQIALQNKYSGESQIAGY